MPRPSWLFRRLVLVLALGVAATACGDDSTDNGGTTTTPVEAPTAAAVSATILGVVEQVDAGLEEPRPVIVAPLYEGTGFSLEIQAEVISTLRGIVDVQFIDDAMQALVDDGAAVVNDSTLLRLALAEIPGSVTKVSGELWRSATDISELSSEVSWQDDDWKAVVTIT